MPCGFAMITCVRGRRVTFLSSYVVAVRDLVAAVDEDREPVCGLEEGAGTVEMICAVFESHRQGGRAAAFPLKERGHPLVRMREEGKK